MMKEENKDDKNKKGKTFIQQLDTRADNSEAIISFLKGLSCQECIDTLDVVKRKILKRVFL